MCNPITTERPDVLLAKGEQDGYEWEVVRVPHTGTRCAYVRIPAGHPWHGKDYTSIDPDVHGGLTFAAADTECGKGGEDNAWWLGFDAHHYMDGVDYDLMDPEHREARRRMNVMLAARGVDDLFAELPVRDTNYMRDECLHLIEQAKEAAEKT